MGPTLFKSTSKSAHHGSKLKTMYLVPQSLSVVQTFYLVSNGYYKKLAFLLNPNKFISTSNNRRLVCLYLGVGLSPLVHSLNYGKLLLEEVHSSILCVKSHSFIVEEDFCVILSKESGEIFQEPTSSYLSTRVRIRYLMYHLLHLWCLSSMITQ